MLKHKSSITVLSTAQTSPTKNSPIPLIERDRFSGASSKNGKPAKIKRFLRRAGRRQLAVSFITESRPILLEIVGPTEWPHSVTFASVNGRVFSSSRPRFCRPFGAKPPPPSSGCRISSTRPRGSIQFGCRTRTGAAKRLCPSSALRDQGRMGPGCR